MLFKQVVLLGCGLIGGSLARALKDKGVAGAVLGYDHNSKNLGKAVEMGVLDQALRREELVPEGTDLLIFATPVCATLQLLAQVADSIPPGCLVTDTGSTKKNVMEAFQKHLLPGMAFVGGHPMAGSEKSGIEAADPQIFQGAAYVLVEGTPSHPCALEKIKKMVRAIGAVPFMLEAEEHDRLVALISHLPHLAAVALTETVRKKGQDERVRLMLLSLAAGGFRDTTRVALGNPGMWKDICLTNSAHIKRALLQLKAEIEQIMYLLEDDAGKNEGRNLLALFERARDFRSQILGKSSALLYPGRTGEKQ
ncbi:MAG: prephenate dehydrogenase/arogenate dehydrogenase family protein [Firmicutes bacterium]|nr:prephenate dehydrogenase/arogenate dehydrogenase family protein [Bacillota bacterium]